VFPPDKINTGGYVGQIWQTRVLPVRVLATNAPPGFISGEVGVFGDTGTVHDGIGYAIDMGADVVNMSFSLICAKQGTPGAVRKDANGNVIGDITCPPEMFDQKLADYRAAFDLAALGRALVVVAPVNFPINLESEDVQDLPAELRLPNQINVAAVDLMDAFRRDISAYGTETINLSAPSKSMPTLNFGGRDEAKTPGFSGLTMEPSAGNSLAAPQVSGTAALVLAVSPELKGNPVAIKDRILRNAVSIEGNRTKVKDGLRLDVFRAVANTVP
jgi:subtilisin family serine protease